jgi:hypothetical protein
MHQARYVGRHEVFRAAPDFLTISARVKDIAFHGLLNAAERFQKTADDRTWPRRFFNSEIGLASLGSSTVSSNPGAHPPMISGTKASNTGSLGQSH